MLHRFTKKQLHLLVTLALVLPLGVIVALPWMRLRAAAPAGPRAAFQYMPQTGHNIGLAIKRFYETHGGLYVFGLPLTEVIEQDGMQVQYFERARFELHPELPPQYRVSLTLLGSLLAQGRADPAFTPRAPSDTADRTFFASTGHTLGGAFGAFWRANGQLPVFGYPLSEEFSEINAVDGKLYLVQYFERARFEYHPEHAGTRYEVLLGQLGSEYAGTRGIAPELRAPAQPIALLGTATVAFAPKTAAGKNMRLAASRLDGLIVKPGQSLSYNAALGEVSARAGYVKGPAIVGGVIQDDIGGGICNVSSALYRAVLAAGLAIDERHAHSRLLAYFEQHPGMDAAVYAPDKDLRWSNDTPYEIMIVAYANAQAGTLTVALWGQSDGRTTSMTRPTILKRAFATDQDSLQPMAYQRPGMDVTIRRVVRDASGQVIRNEKIITHYQPLEQANLEAAGSDSSN